MTDYVEVSDRLREALSRRNRYRSACRDAPPKEACPKCYCGCTEKDAACPECGERLTWIHGWALPTIAASMNKEELLRTLEARLQAHREYVELLQDESAVKSVARASATAEAQLDAPRRRWQRIGCGILLTLSIIIASINFPFARRPRALNIQMVLIGLVGIAILTATEWYGRRESRRTFETSHRILSEVQNVILDSKRIKWHEAAIREEADDVERLLTVGCV